MGLSELARVESEAVHDFAQAMDVDALLRPSTPGERHGRTARLNFDADQAKNGLGQLVLTLVKLLHELLERQAIQRVESGSLSAQQIERLGLTLMRQAEEIERLRKEFGLEEEDLNLNLGPLGRLF
jgi:gas vesicle protein GvpK